MDFKIITKSPASTFEEFEKGAFAGEAEIVEKLKAIEGVDTVETQTYTLENM